MVERVKRSAARNADDTRVGHIGLLENWRAPKIQGRPPTKPPSHLEIVVRVLAPSRSRAEVCALFDHRASYDQIKGWRLGRRGMPPWAYELITQKARDCVLKPLAATMAAMPIGPGSGWNKGATRGIGEWRAKQNLQKRD